MSLYPLSVEYGFRWCVRFYLTRGDLDQTYRYYPCIHSESHNIDWVEDRELELQDPIIRTMIWTVSDIPQHRSAWYI